MPNTSPYRRGHCPTAGQPMQSGDGLLSRVHLLGGRLPVAQLRQLADWAEELAQGQLEITRRGKLQIRGLTADTDADLTARLVGTGLALADSRAEANRKVLCSVAADLDPAARHDPFAIARELEDRLVSNPAAAALSAKFLITLDGNGELANTYSDIRGDAVTTPDGLRYRLSLAGDASSAAPLGLCSPARCADLVEQLIQHFSQLAPTQSDCAPRMADRLTASLWSTFVGQLPVEQGNTSQAIWGKASATPLLGAQPGWFGFAPAFGVLSSQVARRLAALATRHGATAVRVSPAKCLLLPGACGAVAGSLAELGMIISSDDPRRSLQACPGAPACLSGLGATRAPALALAAQVPALFDGQLQIHISGCPKGCAHPGPAALTLVASQDGFDVIVNDRASPRHEQQRIGTGLSHTELVRQLTALARQLQRYRAPQEPLSHCLARQSPSQLQAWLLD